MKPSSSILLRAHSVAILGLAALLIWIWKRPEPAEGTALAQVQQTLALVEAALHEVQGKIDAAPAAGTDSSPQDLTGRLDALEIEISSLKETLKALDMGRLSEERQAAFTSDFGYEKADEYFELGSFTVAGNGYLQFLEAHPDHPDARDIMQKARDAFLRAGYADKAAWVQEQVMARYPGHVADDAYKMALMLKQQHRYDDAIGFVDQAAEAASNDVSRLWRLQYRAFLIQQRDGNAAGVDAYRQVLQQIEAANLSDDNLGVNTRQRIADLEARLANNANP